MLHARVFGVQFFAFPFFFGRLLRRHCEPSARRTRQPIACIIHACIDVFPPYIRTLSTMYKSVPAGAAMALASRAASRLQPAVGVHAAFQFGSSGVLPSQAPSPLSAVAFALAQAPIRRHFGSATVLGAAASDVAGKSLQSASAKLWPSTAELLHGLRSGHRASLAKAITLSKCHSSPCLTLGYHERLHSS